MANNARTVVQVNASTTTGPAFVRWGLPLTGMQLVQLNSSPTATGPFGGTVEALIIDMASPTQHLVSLENLGTTFIGYYVPNGAGGWTFSGATFSALYSPAYVTFSIDPATNQPVFYFIGYQAGSMFLWSWGPNLNVPPVKLATTTLQPSERPSWITAERPVPGLYPSGLIWVSTHDPANAACPVAGRCYDLWAYNPATSCAMLFPGHGGEQVWPDTTASTGTGVWVIQNKPNTPTQGDFLIHELITGLGPCPSNTTNSCLLALTADPDPRISQMDKNILGGTCGLGGFADRLVYSRLFGAGGGYVEFCQNNPPPAPCSLGACNAPLGVLVANVRGTGWGYAEYITTGTITAY